MALDVATVVKQLTDSGIVAPGKLENFVPPKAPPQSVDELVAELVKSENLTPLQAAQVKAGKAKALVLGNYTILDRIGAGGMGQVFKAHHRRMDRTVAIKMLPPAMTKDAAALARFQREVKAAAKLFHPNIVPALDADQAGAVHFLVMEYVAGKDLSALVKNDGPLPVAKAVNYILQAAKGLEFAHGEGVIHRDIKPANLLLNKKGAVRILDMGLARIEQGDGPAQAELTGTGTIMGTVDYMAPEQGVNTKSADARADIYSLGCSLYFLLTGKATYDGDSVAAKLLAHHQQPIPDLRRAKPDVSPQLEAVFKRMVAKRVEDRYQSMTQVVQALEAIQAGSAAVRTSNATAAWTPAANEQGATGTVGSSSAPTKSLAALTPLVAHEKSKNMLAKVFGGISATILALLLVTYLVKSLEKNDEPAAPPAQQVVATTVKPAMPDGPPSPTKAPFDAQQAKAYQDAWAKHLGTKVETINSVGMRMTLIPPGEFLMGSTPEQTAVGRKMGEDDKIPPTDTYFARLADEMPQHKVTISQPFLMGSTDVTVAQFRKFVEASKYVTEAEKHGFGNSGDKAVEKAKEADKRKNWKNPVYPTTDDTAVTQISWNDACAYCAWLSEQEQRRSWYRPDGKGGWLVAASADGYRLPTEAEWEYGCRAGATTQYSFGDDKSQLAQHGWFVKNAWEKAQPVALKLPNSFGLFDMHGNVLEWCQDWFDGKGYGKSSPTDPRGPSSGSFRVLRGGYWSSYASFCRSACRSYYSPSFHLDYAGFRCVRVWYQTPTN